jgi:hypothetical protein
MNVEGQDGHAPLAPLLKRVVEARALVSRRRDTQVHRDDDLAARAELLAALEAYASALESLHLPVPYAMRDEMRIQQRVARESARWRPGQRRP